MKKHEGSVRLQETESKGRGAVRNEKPKKGEAKEKRWGLESRGEHETHGGEAVRWWWRG